MCNKNKKIIKKSNKIWKRNEHVERKNGIGQRNERRNSLSIVSPWALRDTWSNVKRQAMHRTRYLWNVEFKIPRKDNHEAWDNICSRYIYGQSSIFRGTVTRIIKTNQKLIGVALSLYFAFLPFSLFLSSY